VGKPYCWGDAKQGDGGKWYANSYQGQFPKEDSGADGFKGLAPVKSFPPNGYGLYDMSGNAWEWCQDYYDPDYYGRSPKDNPEGPAPAATFQRRPAAARPPGRVVPVRRPVLPAVPAERPRQEPRRQQRQPHRLPLRQGREVTPCCGVGVEAVVGAGYTP